MTNKTIKAEVKAYLDHLSGLAVEDCQPLARQLAHDIYDLFKATKRPDKETVIVKEPVDDAELKAELAKLKIENGKLKLSLSKSEDKEAALHKGHLMATGAFAGGLVVGRSLQCVKQDQEVDVRAISGSALRAVVCLTGHEITNKDLHTVCRGMAGYMIEYKAKTNPAEGDVDLDELADEFYGNYWETLQGIAGDLDKNKN